MYKYSTDIGKNGIGDAVFARIATESAGKFGSNIIFTNQKGKPMRIGTTGRENLNFIEVTTNKHDNSISLRIYITVKFGLSISLITKQFASEIRSSTLILTGIEVKDIVIVITGVKSKKTARREIEIKC